MGTRYTAYVAALVGHADAALQAAGAQTNALLTAYNAATAAKNQGTKAVKDTISALGPEAVALADALWAVHCAALYVHRTEPATATVYFDYNKLPQRNIQRTGRRQPSVVPAMPVG